MQTGRRTSRRGTSDVGIIFSMSKADRNEKEVEKRLRAEGFTHTYFWRDHPHACYPDHVHAAETAHVILEGEMMLTMGGQTHTFSAGERCDVPAGTVHSARMGPAGCRYLIGEK
jgi:quercetin dioxygenase-like cupin family protein